MLTPLRMARREFEASYAMRALELAGGNIALAARLAGLDRKGFYSLMDRAGVERPHRAGRPAVAERYRGVR